MHTQTHTSTCKWWVDRRFDWTIDARHIQQKQRGQQSRHMQIVADLLKRDRGAGPPANKATQDQPHFANVLLFVQRGCNSGSVLLIFFFFYQLLDIYSLPPLFVCLFCFLVVFLRPDPVRNKTGRLVDWLTGSCFLQAALISLLVDWEGEMSGKNPLCQL